MAAAASELCSFSVRAAQERQTRPGEDIGGYLFSFTAVDESGQPPETPAL